MKLLSLFILWLIGLSAARVITEKADEKTPWDLSDALTSNSRIRGFNGTWITDNEFYHRTSDNSIRKYNAATKVDTLFVPSEYLSIYGSGTSFTFSPDITKILVRYDVEEVFRHSLIAKYDVLDIENGAAIKIHNGKKLQYCGWAPIKDRLAFVYENNVYVHLENNTEKQITDDGIKGIVYLGVPDWVYEEEVLSSGSALWWSPDGQKLAVGVFDDRDVQTFKYTIYGEAESAEFLYPEEVDLKYPKPGTTNPTVALRVYDLSEGTLQMDFANITAPRDIVTEDHILQNVAWPSNDHVLVTWLNRRQNVGTMQQCTLDGVCHEVLNLKELDGWITIGTPRCLKSSANCLFTYWIDDKYQIWNLDLLTGKNI